MVDTAEKKKLLIGDDGGDEEERKFEMRSFASFTYSDAGFEEDDNLLGSYQQRNNATTYVPHEGSIPVFASRDRFPKASMFDADSVRLGIVYLVVLTSDMSRGLLFPTLWLVVHSVGGGPSEQGLAVSAFSVGRLLSTTAVGYWSERLGCRLVLCLCNLVIIVGALIYIYAAVSGVAGVALVVTAQLVIGVGAGSLGATRGFVAEKTPRDKRTEQLAVLTALQYGGFTVTPIIGALLSAYFGTIFHNSTVAYTLPVLFLILSAATCVLLLVFFFHEEDRFSAHGKKEYVQVMDRADSMQSVGFDSPRVQRTLDREEEYNDEDEVEELKEPSQTTSNQFSNLQRHYSNESIGFDSPVSSGKNNAPSAALSERTPLRKAHSMASTASEGFVHSPVSRSPFHHQGNHHATETTPSAKTLRQLSIAGCFLNMVTKGTISVFETLTVMFLTEHFHWDSLQSGLTISMCGVVGVGFLLSFPILLRFVQDIDLVLFGLAIMVLACLLVDSVPFLGQHHDVYSKSEEERIYMALVLMFAVGYPIGHTALIGAFSKINQSGPQGTMMGIFGSCGSIARIIFPTLSGIIATQLGFAYAFLFTAIALVLSMLLMAWYRRTVQQILNA